MLIIGISSLQSSTTVTNGDAPLLDLIGNYNATVALYKILKASLHNDDRFSC